MADETGLRGRSELTQRVISALILAALALGVAWYGGAPFILVWLLLAAAVAYEWQRMIGSPAPLWSSVVPMAFLGIAGWAPAMNGPGAAWMSIGAAGLAMTAAALLAGAGRRGWAVGGVFYAGALFLATILLRGLPGSAGTVDGFIVILFLYSAVWATDIGAYFAGRRFGGPKFAPRISPKKTWSGVAGGLVAGMLAAVLLLAVAGVSVRLWHGLIALTLGVAVVLGDLFESWLKRRFGVKDAGALIPGHGGFMDRLDGYVFAAVVAAVVGIARGGWDNAAGGLLR